MENNNDYYVRRDLVNDQAVNHEESTCKGNEKKSSPSRVIIESSFLLDEYESQENSKERDQYNTRYPELYLG